MDQPGRIARGLSWVSWKWATLAVLLALTGLLALLPQTTQADGVGSAFTGTGNIQVHGFRQDVDGHNMVVYAYVGVGEKLRFDIRKTFIVTTPTSADGMTIQIYSPTGQVGSNLSIAGLAALNTGVNNGTVPNASYIATAATAGIWTIRMTPLSVKLVFSYDIDVLNTANTPINGRVYTSDYLKIFNDNNATFNLHHINNYGYEYTSTFTNYRGIDSYIRTDQYGVTQAGQCVPAYRSANFSDPTASWILPTSPCGGVFKQFFTAIDQSMPVSAPRFNYLTNATVNEWLNPDVVTPSVTGLTFNKTLGNPAAGSFTFTVGGYEGIASLQIDANNDGDYVDAVDRTIPFSAVLGENTIAFDGLNGQGVMIGCGQTVGARVLIDKVGEIHFTMSDVEGLGGLRITRNNGPSPNSIIYWDDRSLSTAGLANTTPTLNGTGGVNSAVTGGVHGWGYSLTSWGNNRHIDNWTYAAQNITASTSFTTVCDFGDAPDSYSTTAVGNGPSHATLGLVFIGSTVDGETTGTASVSANSDDTTGLDDEDGITSTPPILVACTNSYTLTVPVSNITGNTAQLGGWIDFNRNGIFDGSEFAQVGVPNGATTATLTWTNVQNTGITAGESYIRLRISTQAFNQPGGALPDGEVEDYPITIQPALQAGVTSTSATGCAVADGTLSLTATGGTGSFQYSLDGGATWAAFTSPHTVPGLARGGYSVMIRDASVTSCTQEHQVVIDAANCCDFNQNQPISFQPVDPGAGFTVQYLLTTPAGEILVVSNTPSFPAQAPGSYHIRVLAYNTASPAPTGVTVGQPVSGIAGCCFRLAPPTPIGICECPTFTLLDNNYQVCAGENLALLRVTTSAATPNQVEFVYFTTPQTSASAIYGGGTVLGSATPASNVAQLSDVAFPATAGTYYVYSRISPAPDDPNCRPYAEIPVSVTVCCNLDASLAALPVTNCENLADGSLEIEYSGSQSYEYNLNGGSFQPLGSSPFSVTGLAAGTYTVVIQAVGDPTCMTTLSGTIVTPTAPVVSTVVVTNPTDCTANNGGLAIVLVNSEEGIFQYSIDNGGSWQTGNTFSGLVPGNYTVLVRNAVAPTCFVNAGSFTIQSPGGITAQIGGQNQDVCALNQCTVTITASGGSGTYEYSLDGGLTWADLSTNPLTRNNLAPSNYLVVVRDKAIPSCQVQELVELATEECPVPVVAPFRLTGGE